MDGIEGSATYLTHKARGGSRNVERGVLIEHVQGRRKQLVVALAMHRGA